MSVAASRLCLQVCPKPSSEPTCCLLNLKICHTFAGMLRAGSLNCREVASEHEIDALAAEKLIWATCMWMVRKIPSDLAHTSLREGRGPEML